MGSPFRKQPNYSDDFKKRTDKIIEEVPEFNYRGTDTYNDVIDNRSIESPYYKSKNDRKLPYLSSRHYQYNPRDPRETSFRFDQAQERDLNSVSDDRRFAESQMAAGADGKQLGYDSGKGFTGYNGNPESLKSANESAASSVDIFDDLMSGFDSATGGTSSDQQSANQAVFDAQESFNSEIVPRTGYPMKEDPRTGEYIPANAPSYETATMIDAFNNVRKKAESAQDLVDYNRGLKQRLNKMKSSLNKPNFDVRSGN